MTVALLSRRGQFATIGLGALGVLAAGWLFGLVAFVAADGHFQATLPRRRSPPAASHNLALWEMGPTVRASSYYADWKSHHHPLFLVDGRTQPDLIEKWASGYGDRRPWIEILWREPHDLERVVLRHAGSVEPADMTVRRYSIQCLGRAGPGPRLDVEENHAAVAEHLLACEGVVGVRIEFVPNGNDVVRVFEVETWGR